jgi:hypothetical protein
MKLLAVILTAFALVACGGGSSSSAPAVNAAPVAQAWPTQLSIYIGALVTLEGSGVADDGSTLTYSWTLTTPAGSLAKLSASNTSKPSFIPDVSGKFVATLVVNDGKSISAGASVVIDVPADNVPPIANAGTNQNVIAGALVTLDGSASSDPNKDTLTYLWALTEKPPGSLAQLVSPTSAKPTLTPDLPGTYSAFLSVNDGKLNSGGALVRIYVTGVGLNVPPVANAGMSLNVTLGRVVTLDGSASSDANRDALTYSWTLTSKPVGSAATLAFATFAQPRFTADIAGTYVASLIVNDGKVNSTPATVSMTTLAASANVPPVANPGIAQNVITGSLVTLNGSASSDANGDGLTYAWTLTGRPNGSTAVLVSTTSAKPSFTADVAGTYVASLIVNDGKINSSTATVSVTAATASTNVAPIANAGATQNVLTGSVVTLNGSTSSDANGDALTYSWTLTGKPAGSAAVLTSATSVKPTFIADTAGTYVASLIVKDGKINSNTATVAVTAAAASTNVAPIANAGVSQNVTTGTLVTLNGSASLDANGDALKYSWTLTSKPAGSAAVLTSATSAKPTFTADVAGTYVASLIVNDGKVNSTAATVTATAATPPSTTSTVNANCLNTLLFTPGTKYSQVYALSGNLNTTVSITTTVFKSNFQNYNDAIRSHVVTVSPSYPSQYADEYVSSDLSRGRVNYGFTKSDADNGAPTSMGIVQFPQPDVRDSLAVGESASVYVTTVVTVNGSPSDLVDSGTYTFTGYEDVTVPAGTFLKACKFQGVGQNGNETTWLSAKSGIMVKFIGGFSSFITTRTLTSATINGVPIQ